MIFSPRLSVAPVGRPFPSPAHRLPRGSAWRRAFLWPRISMSRPSNSRRLIPSVRQQEERRSSPRSLSILITTGRSMPSFTMLRWSPLIRSSVQPSFSQTCRNSFQEQRRLTEPLLAPKHRESARRQRLGPPAGSRIHPPGGHSKRPGATGRPRGQLESARLDRTEAGNQPLGGQPRGYRVPNRTRTKGQWPLREQPSPFPWSLPDSPGLGPGTSPQSASRRDAGGR